MPSVNEPSPHHIDVALVAMPFAPLHTPSIGLGLLQAGLKRRDIAVRTFYFSFQFAKLIGELFYDQLSDGEPARADLVGEWIFNGELFDAKAIDIEGYVREVLRGGSRHHSTVRNDKWYEQRQRSENNCKGISEQWISQVLEARSSAGTFLDQCRERLLAWSPKIVGFTSMFEQHVASLALARRIRSSSRATFIVLGGSNCEGPMGAQTARSFPFLNAVFSGEADDVFPEVVQAVLDGRNIPERRGVFINHGISAAAAHEPTTEQNGSTGEAVVAEAIKDMDSLPFPDYDDYFEQLKTSEINFAGIASPNITFETARGCWWGERHHCTFCGLNGTTLKFRSKTPDRALEELQYLTNRYGGYSVAVTDNILDYKYLKTFVPQLKALNLGVNLFYEVKANLKKDDVLLLRDAGITRIQPGIESFSTPILKLMRKGTTAIQNIQLLKWCAELGVTPVWGILWGFPGEDPEEYTRTAALLPSLTHFEPPIGITAIRLDRFSPNYVNATSFGFRNVAPFPSYKYVYPLPEDAVANLAYFFTYDYQDGRDVPGYVAGVVAGVNLWRRESATSALLYLDARDCVFVFDLRSGAPRAAHVLSDLRRTIFLACDEATSFSTICKAVEMVHGRNAIVEIRPILDEFVAARLMVRENDRYLCLAVKLGLETLRSEFVPRLDEMFDDLARAHTSPLPGRMLAQT
jgi:ribosomal peptide maturation radical SAM protein 1